MKTISATCLVEGRNHNSHNVEYENNIPIPHSVSTANSSMYRKASSGESRHSGDAQPVAQDFDSSHH